MKETNFEKVKEEFRKFGYELLDDTDRNISASEYVELLEISTGYKGFSRLFRMRQGSKISKFDMRVNSKYFIYNMNVWAKSHGLRSKIIGFADKQRWTRLGIKCVCECGNEFETSYTSYMNGKVCCDVCTKRRSEIEMKAEYYLDDLRVDYIREYRFPDCKHILALPFDFYIPDINACIECDGIGHFKPAYFNNCSYETGKKSFELTKVNDEIKDEYCKNNDIKLLRIPYWEFEDDTYKEKIKLLFSEN